MSLKINTMREIRIIDITILYYFQRPYSCKTYAVWSHYNTVEYNMILPAMDPIIVAGIFVLNPNYDLLVITS